MSAIQVNLLEALHEALRRRAAQEGLDIPAYVLRLIAGILRCRASRGA